MNCRKKLSNSELDVLECTLRDGSYAVDFRFTYTDTALLCRILSGLGFKFLEVGHGMGINASKAGKGDMPATDEEIVKIAKLNAKDSYVGMFCIPGIASLSDLKRITSQGLDFVRIGSNPEDIEKALPYIEAARKNNLYTFVNFMKSYCVTPKKLALKAKMAVSAGAQAVYVVDSAGCMLPEEVAGYISEIKEVTNAKIGFHGHNNLHLAVANTLKAVESGAHFIDTTLYGLGRNAGNAPTEVIIAILQSMRICLGIDLVKLMKAIDHYISPLMRQIQMYDMLSVTMGLAKFHSGFLPYVSALSEKHKVDLHSLILKAGQINPATLNKRALIAYARSLKKHAETHSPNPAASHDLLSFNSSKIRNDRISNTLQSVKYLTEELINVSAKMRSRIIMELTPAKNKDAGMVFAEYITSNQDIAMGRITFGSIEVLDAVIKIIKPYASFALIDIDAAADWLRNTEISQIIEKHFKGRIIFYSSTELLTSSIFEIFLNYKNVIKSRNLLIIGPSIFNREASAKLSKLFDCIFIYTFERGEKPESIASRLHILPDNCIQLEASGKWREVNLNVHTALSFFPLTDSRIDKITKSFTALTHFFFLDHLGNGQSEKFSRSKNASYIKIDVSRAYNDHIARWLSLNEELLSFSSFNRSPSHN